MRGRLNIVVSRTKIFEGVRSFPSLDDALAFAESRAKDIFVIGGYSLIREAIGHPSFGTLHLSRIQGSFPCDLFIHEWDGVEEDSEPTDSWEEVNREDEKIYKINVYDIQC